MRNTRAGISSSLLTSLPFFNLNVGNDSPHSRLGLLGPGRPALQPLDPISQPHTVIIDNRDLTGRIRIILIAGHPINPIVCPQREPLVVAMLVDESRLAVEKCLDLLPIPSHRVGPPWCEGVVA